MKFEIFNFDTVTSTNDVAIDMIIKKKNETGYVYSKTQTKGKGTRGKSWVSHKGNLFGSIFFPLVKDYPSFNEFALINPIIISDVIKKFCKNCKINIKWPNDIFINRKKVCGILQEVITSNAKKFLIIGIGINIVSNPSIIKKYQATNILNETKKNPSVNEVVSLIILSYEKFFNNLSSYDYKDFKKKAELMSLN
tara:strand:+ start:173 stop:757 length:585 start_codon:yes stop_codon:yes gene_type:complete